LIVIVSACESGGRPTLRDRAAAVGGEAYLEAACDLPHTWVERIYRGLRPGAVRAQDLIMVPDPPHYAGGVINTSHSGPYDYLQDVPLIFHGPGFVRAPGTVGLDREVTLADLPPTYAALMGYDFPRREGRPLTELLRDTQTRPRLIVTIVIDGGGWNVLRHWPDAWPNLNRMIASGASIDGATVGSSPSITPAIHTNLATGSFPRSHGVTSILVRKDDGSIVGGFHPEVRYAGSEAEPSLNLRQTTLADLWDRDTDNAAKIGVVAFGNYIAGMAGHGTDLAGGDADIVALEEEGGWKTDPTYYSLPAYLAGDEFDPQRDLDKADLLDGEADGQWRGHELAPFDATPAFAPWENRAVKAIIGREGFGADDLTDLFYINYKAPDMAGHKWNMIAPEQRDVIGSVDAAIGDLVAWLDGRIGPNSYVLTVTADHGQTPLEQGGWPLNGTELKDDLDRAFGQRKSGTIVEMSTTSALFVDREALEARGVTAAEVASFLTTYTIGDNAGRSEEVPREFEGREDERIFAAVIPSGRIGKVLACTEGS
jgi:hypothetical protein